MRKEEFLQKLEKLLYGIPAEDREEAPFSALIMVGGGLLMVGLGLIGIVFAIWLVFKVLPKMCTGIADICSKLFSK